MKHVHTQTHTHTHTHTHSPSQVEVEGPVGWVLHSLYSRWLQINCSSEQETRHFNLSCMKSGCRIRDPEHNVLFHQTELDFNPVCCVKQERKLHCHCSSVRSLQHSESLWDTESRRQEPQPNFQILWSPAFKLWFKLAADDSSLQRLSAGRYWGHSVMSQHPRIDQFPVNFTFTEMTGTDY